MTQATPLTSLRQMTNFLNSLHGDAFADADSSVTDLLAAHMRTKGLTTQAVRAYLQQAQRRAYDLGEENKELTELSQDKEAKERERTDTRTRTEALAFDRVPAELDEQVANKRRRIEHRQTVLLIVQLTLVEAHKQAKDRQTEFKHQQETDRRQERKEQREADSQARYEAAQRALADRQAAAAEKAKVAAAEAASSAATGVRRVNVKAAEYNRANKQEERALQSLRAAANDRIQALSIAVLEADLRQRGVPIPLVAAAAQQNAVSEQQEREEKSEVLAQQD